MWNRACTVRHFILLSVNRMECIVNLHVLWMLSRYPIIPVDVLGALRLLLLLSQTVGIAC